MKTTEKMNDVSPELLRQMRFEASNPDWQEGFTAFAAREPFTMSKGRDWAMGWLSCRLLGAGLASRYVQ